jgi:NAD(P)H-dependent FMN reductase
MKNELIMARYTGHKKAAAAQRLRALLDEFGLTDLLHTRFTALPDNSSLAPARPSDPDAAAQDQI